MIEKLVRENIKKLKPYSSAKHEFEGAAMVYLDANENPFGSSLPVNYNRYPDPLQIKLKEKVSLIKGVPVESIFLGNGSDEAIDLLLRVFCEPGLDNIIICPPTYGIYEVFAMVNDTRIKKVNLSGNFQLDTVEILKAIDEHTKMIFICSPNNPTGNCMNRVDVESILETFSGLVVIDEAYIDYSGQYSYTHYLNKHPGLVVLQTFSKAWGLAGLRLGMAFASPMIIYYLNKVKSPYNINEATQFLVSGALESELLINEWTRQVQAERTRLMEQLATIPIVKKLYPSDANFVLVKFENAENIYKFLLSSGIVVRNRTMESGCDNCLRITVGTPDQNDELLKELKKYAV